MTPTGLPGEAVNSFSGYARSQIGGLANVLSRCRAIFFQLFLHFAIIYDSYHWENCFKGVSSNNPQHLLSVHGNLGLREKSSNLSFLRDMIWKIRLFAKIYCFQISISFLNTLVVNFWNLAALRRHLLSSDWLLLTFDMTIFFFG